jgi:precorrin-6A/cobalt-precorrin-6A reductase
MTVLILGGTAEARVLAHRLVEQRTPVISSLAGRVASPALPAGDVRIGGYGGADGLAQFLTQRQIRAVVDATHPFAAQMSAHAAAAARLTGTPLLRLARPGWREHGLAGRWHWVDDLSAARAAAERAERPFLTTGRQSLPAFAGWGDRAVLVRLVDPPEQPLPPRWQVIQSRGPYGHDDERQLMLDHRVDALLTKDSGGAYTVAKVEVATELGIPVVIVARPPVEPGVRAVATVDAVLSWLSCRGPNSSPSERPVSQR